MLIGKEVVKRSVGMGFLRKSCAYSLFMATSVSPLASWVILSKELFSVESKTREFPFLKQNHNVDLWDLLFRFRNNGHWLKILQIVGHWTPSKHSLLSLISLFEVPTKKHRFYLGTFGFISCVWGSLFQSFGRKPKRSLDGRASYPFHVYLTRSTQHYAFVLDIHFLVH